jgi:hypothetical protein
VEGNQIMTKTSDSDPLDRWVRRLEAIEEAERGFLEESDDPMRPVYLDWLRSKKTEFRERIRAILRRN